MMWPASRYLAFHTYSSGSRRWRIFLMLELWIQARRRILRSFMRQRCRSSSSPCNGAQRGQSSRLGLLEGRASVRWQEVRKPVFTFHPILFYAILYVYRTCTRRMTSTFLLPRSRHSSRTIPSSCSFADLSFNIFAPLKLIIRESVGLAKLGKKYKDHRWSFRRHPTPAVWGRLHLDAYPVHAETSDA